MTDTLTLFDGTPELVRITVPDAWTIQERFELFHEANEWVYEALKRLALDMVARGHRRIGIGMLFEVVRWQYGRATDGDDFKLNNSYRSRYARLLMSEVPALEGVFETRELKTP